MTATGGKWARVSGWTTLRGEVTRVYFCGPVVEQTSTHVTVEINHPSGEKTLYCVPSDMAHVFEPETSRQEGERSNGPKVVTLHLSGTYVGPPTKECIGKWVDEQLAEHNEPPVFGESEMVVSGDLSGLGLTRGHMGWSEAYVAERKELVALRTRVAVLESGQAAQTERAERAEAELAKLRAEHEPPAIEPIDGVAHPDTCVFREPDSCSGIYRCFLHNGGRGAIGKGFTEAEAYADFAAKFKDAGAGKK